MTVTVTVAQGSPLAVAGVNTVAGSAPWWSPQR